jgi:hypothetical protein
MGLRAMAARPNRRRHHPGQPLARIHHPRLWSSALARTGLIASVITVMVAKPGQVAALVSCCPAT